MILAQQNISGGIINSGNKLSGAMSDFSQQYCYPDYFDGRFEELEKMYSIPNKKEVRDYLSSRTIIFSILKEAKPFLDKIFSKPVVRLEIFDDPESGESALMALIEITMKPKEAVVKMNEFWKDFLSLQNSIWFKNVFFHVEHQ